MSTTTNQVSGLLAKLENGLNKKKTGGKKDWAAINEARKKAMWKPKEGKNQVLVLTPAFGEDPFTFWGYHQGLQEVDYYSIPCDHKNKDEKCVVCEVVDSLQADNWAGNKYLWMPIELKSETYVPVIDLTSPATMAEGPKWWRVSKTIMNQMVENLKNLEDGEFPFFNHEHPQRILITYNKNEAPATQYSVQFKDMKDVPTAEQYAAWSSTIQPIGEYIFSKSQEEAKKLVDEYFVRMAEKLDEEEAAPNTSEEESAPAEENATSKLSRLKSK